MVKRETWRELKNIWNLNEITSHICGEYTAKAVFRCKLIASNAYIGKEGLERPVVKSVLPRQGVQVRDLVREWRSCMAQKEKNK